MRKASKKEKNIKCSHLKKIHIACGERKVRMMPDLSETMQAKRQWRERNFKVLFRKKKPSNLKFYAQPKKKKNYKWRQNKNDFSNIQILREFIDNGSAVQGMLMEVLQAKGKCYQIDIFDFSKIMKTNKNGKYMGKYTKHISSFKKIIKRQFSV